MNEATVLYDALAGLLAYPGDDHRERLDACRDALARHHPEARQLVDDVFTAAREALDKQRGALDDWQSGESGQPDDTERLRVAVRGYRDFLDRMLGV